MKRILSLIFLGTFVFAGYRKYLCDPVVIAWPERTTRSRTWKRTDTQRSVVANPDIAERIRKHSAEHGVDYALALDLATFESGLNPKARNPRSTAKGVYQFLDSTWDNLCTGNVLDPDDNIGCAMRLLGENPRNISHWTADHNTRAFLISKGYVQRRSH